MKKNKKAFSLVIVMGIVLVSSLLALILFELIFPFSKSVIGVENSSRAYYLANSGLEEALYKLKENENINDVDFSLNKNDFSDLTNFDTSRAGVKVYLDNKGKNEPGPGKGNSEFDKDFNKISVGEPIQMDLTGLSNLDNLKIQFQVPKIDLFGSKELSGNDNSPYISWQLSSDTDFYNSSEATSITKTQINSKSEINIFGLGRKGWYTGISYKFSKFGCDKKKCVLKFSIINELKAPNGVSIPYLEWKITNGIGEDFKLRYANISSEGKETGYLRKLEVKVPQNTVNEAFDFAVFQ